MAVYTKIKKEDMDNFFLKYNLGKIISYHGITEGIENTNYFVKTDQGKFIFTIFEKRVNATDLPFFMGLMLQLHSLKFKCPKPMINKSGEYISEIKNKKAAVVSFVEGESKKILNPKNCYDIGIETARMHKISQNYKKSRPRKNENMNAHSIIYWNHIFDKIETKCFSIDKNLSFTIKESLKEINKNWPSDLPAGIIHADLFPDNIFFIKEKFSGFIDFYFSCRDFYGFEIAVCINALCFDGNKENLSFNATKAKKFIDGYSSIRKLDEKEKMNLKVLSQGAAMRFLLTRVFDYINLRIGAAVTIKDPIEYLKRLEFHNSVKNYNDYYI